MGGLGEGAFILEVEGPRPLSVVVRRPPEGNQRHTPVGLSPVVAVRLPVQQVPQALTGLASGFLPAAQPRLGLCEVRGVTPHLWPLVAEAMDFTVIKMRRRDPAFGRLLKLYGVSGEILLGSRPRYMHGYHKDALACVFLDRQSLEGLAHSDWRRWLCPHIFHCRDGEEDKPPPGWSHHSLRIPHAHAGGSTDAVWWIVHWTPPGYVLPPAPALRREPWTPL